MSFGESVNDAQPIIPPDLRKSAQPLNFTLGAFVFLRLSSAHAQPASHFQPGLRFGHAPWVFAVARLLRVVACRPSRCVSSCRRITSADFFAVRRFVRFIQPAPNPALKRTCAKSRAARLALRSASPPRDRTGYSDALLPIFFRCFRPVLCSQTVAEVSMASIPS